MEGVAGKSKMRDGSELVSDDSVTESRDSSSRSTSSESRSSSDNSSSAQLGWPIRKAANCLQNGASEGKIKPPLNVAAVDDDDDSKLKKHGSKVSGKSSLVFFLSLLFCVSLSLSISKIR